MGEALAGDLIPHDGVSKGKSSALLMPHYKSNRSLAENFKLEEFGFKYNQSFVKEVNPNSARN